MVCVPGQLLPQWPGWFCSPQHLVSRFVWHQADRPPSQGASPFPSWRRTTSLSHWLLERALKVVREMAELAAGSAQTQETSSCIRQELRGLFSGQATSTFLFHLRPPRKIFITFWQTKGCLRLPNSRKMYSSVLPWLSSSPSLSFTSLLAEKQPSLARQTRMSPFRYPFPQPYTSATTSCHLFSPQAWARKSNIPNSGQSICIKLSTSLIPHIPVHSHSTAFPYFSGQLYQQGNTALLHSLPLSAAFHVSV